MSEEGIWVMKGLKVAGSSYLKEGLEGNLSAAELQGVETEVSEMMREYGEAVDLSYERSPEDVKNREMDLEEERAHQRDHSMEMSL